MSRAILVLVLILMAALVFQTGCCAEAQKPPRIEYSAKNLLFNPKCNMPAQDTIRADWPVTSTFEHQREQFTYRETIIDRQGRHGSNQDYFLRRFDSVRTGTTSR